MNRPFLFALIGLGLLFSSFNICFGQEARHGAASPQVILVQLRSEQRRLKFLINRPEKAVALAAEAAKIRTACINDFKDHFKYCTVYFYIDTNADKVKAKQFDNVLLTADGSIVQNPQLQDYYIVYYGYPEDDKHSYLVTSSADYKYGNGNVMGKGLVVLDKDYIQMHQPFPYFVWKMDYWDLFVKRDTKYHYRSKKYDMEYFPLATPLDRELKDFFVLRKPFVNQLSQ